jgi:hypothetical protein
MTRVYVYLLHIYPHPFLFPCMFLQFRFFFIVHFSFFHFILLCHSPYTPPPPYLNHTTQTYHTYLKFSLHAAILSFLFFSPSAHCNHIYFCFAIFYFLSLLLPPLFLLLFFLSLIAHNTTSNTPSFTLPPC